MASGGSRLCRPPCRSPRRNHPPIDLVEDELTRDLSPVGGCHLGGTSSALFCNPSPGPDQVPALVPALISAPAPTDKLFKKLMKAYLELNQGPRQPLAERERPLKAKLSEVYYGK